MSERSFASVGAETRQIQMIWLPGFTFNDISVVAHLSSQHIGLTSHNDFVQKAQIIKVHHRSHREPPQVLYHIGDMFALWAELSWGTGKIEGPKTLFQCESRKRLERSPHRSCPVQILESVQSSPGCPLGWLPIPHSWLSKCTWARWEWDQQAKWPSKSRIR